MRSTDQDLGEQCLVLIILIIVLAPLFGVIATVFTPCPWTLIAGALFVTAVVIICSPVLNNVDLDLAHNSRLMDTCTLTPVASGFLCALLASGMGLPSLMAIFGLSVSLSSFIGGWGLKPLVGRCAGAFLGWFSFVIILYTVYSFKGKAVFHWLLPIYDLESAMTSFLGLSCR